MAREMLIVTRGRAAIASCTSADVWRRLAFGFRWRAGPAELPSWDDAELGVSLDAVAHLSDEECREFLGSLYRAVHGYERSGDVTVLKQFAREARTTAQLWARPDFRDDVRHPATPVPYGSAISVGDVLAKLDG